MDTKVERGRDTGIDIKLHSDGRNSLSKGEQRVTKEISH